MTAKSGEIGGWKITASALESKAENGAQKMTLGSDGSITIGKLTGSDKTDSAFEVTKNGVMKAANYVLEEGSINTALMMKGKMRISSYGSVTNVKN
jgi:hypothetical protein